jgi:hypothetical protein
MRATIPLSGVFADRPLEFFPGRTVIAEPDAFARTLARRYCRQRDKARFCAIVCNAIPMDAVHHP